MTRLLPTRKMILMKKRIYSVNEEVFGFRCMTVIIAELISSDRY